MNNLTFGRAPLFALLLACSCGAHVGGSRPVHAASAPAPLASITSDEEFDRRRDEFEALDVHSPSRPAERARLLAWLQQALQSDVTAERQDSAFEHFQQALTLWDPGEVAALSAPVASASANGKTNSANGRVQSIDARALRDLGQAAVTIERLLRRRGAHRQVLTALAVLRTLMPADPGVKQRFEEVTGWLLEQGSFEDSARTILTEDLADVVRVWPARFVVDQLATLYLDDDGHDQERHRRGLRSGPLDLSQLQQRLRQARIPLAYKLAVLYLRIDDPLAAVAALRKLEGKPGADTALRLLLQRYSGPGSTVRDVLDVAQQIVRTRDLDVAERICRHATRRHPTSAEPWLCVGSVAEQRSHVLAALQAMTEGQRLAPERRDIWDELAMLHQLRLLELSNTEAVDTPDALAALVGQLGRTEALHQAAGVRYPKTPLTPSLAGALFEVGRGHFNAGLIDQAVSYLERSLAVEPTVQTLELLGIIATKRGQPTQAVAHFERGRGLITPRTPRRAAQYWRAKLERGLADALDAIDDKQATSARRRADAEWAELVRESEQGGESALPPERVAEAEIERGKVLYQLGQRAEALDAFARGIDAAPNRTATYADLLAFLVPRGEHDDALDAYHRALGRPDIVDSLKVYCTLWILDLGRRRGEPDDPLARSYLEGVTGTQWHAELARWALGRISDDELKARADTRAKRAEAVFYLAMRELQHGRPEPARLGWQAVLDSGMMGFFEYDMAAYYLRRGATSPSATATPVPP